MPPNKRNILDFSIIDLDEEDTPNEANRLVRPRAGMNSKEVLKHEASSVALQESLK